MGYSYAELSKDFAARGIPAHYPGFFDHPNFVLAESADKAFLNNYAAYVASRPQTSEYLEDAGEKIPKAAEKIRQHLVRNGRKGACVDISLILSRILEREGIWNYVVKGSLTIDFPAESGLGPEFFWSVDFGEFVAGHAWVVAPPYCVIDITVKLQPYPSAKAPFIPDSVIERMLKPDALHLNDIVSPSAQRELEANGIRKEHQLSKYAADLEKIASFLPTGRVETGLGASLKYCPIGIGAPDCPFEEMRNMDFNGRTPFQVYVDEFQGQLG